MKFKALCFGVALALTSVSGTVNAVMPVIDNANLQSSLKQYAQLIKQLEQLEAQLTQAKKEYASITGGRGMGNLSRTDETYIPLNWQETLDIIENGGEVGSLAEQIREASSKLDEEYFGDVDGDIKKGLNDSMGKSATGQALNAEIYDSSKERMERLVELADEVNSAQDLKAISDLQARIAIENGMLTNELLRLQAMNAMAENERRVLAQQSLQETFEITKVKY